MIYLASPYSHPSTAVRQFRYHQASEFQVLQLKNGVHLYSPIAAHHHQAETLPESDDFWKPLNENMIARSEEVWVLTLPEWEKSKGVSREIEFAISQNIPIRYFAPAAFLQE